MASAIQDAFKDLHTSIQLVISNLLETHPQQLELVYQEVTTLSVQLDALVARHHTESNRLSNLGTVSHNHAADSASGIEPLESASPFGGASTDLISNEGSCIGTQDPPVVPATLDKHPLSCQRTTAENTSDNIPCDDGSRLPDTSIISADLPSDDSVSPEPLCIPSTTALSVLPSPLHSQERPHDPTVDTLSTCSLPQSLPSHYWSPQSPNSQGPPQAGNPSVSILYEIQDGVIRLSPTIEQWHEFPTLLQCARELGAENVGICKVLLPEDVAGMSKPFHHTKQKGFRYSAHPQSNGTFSLERTEQDNMPCAMAELCDVTSETVAVQQFEQLLRNKSGLDAVRYCTDIDVRTSEARESLGLSTSPIWPLKGDRLSETRMRIPGIHWPYAYEAWEPFGAPFAMHREDGDLLSINYLYEGEKHWVVISKDQAKLLEEKSIQTNKHYYLSHCAQLLRHSATYYPTSVLNEWKISYQIIHQKGGEVVITFPQVYHQGFSAGYTFAEAVNYADQNWNIHGYHGCGSPDCSDGSIKNSMLEFRGQDEEQCSEGDSDDARHASNLTAKKKPQAHRKDHFTVKTREVSQRNPGQKPTAVKRKPGVQSSEEAPRKVLKKQKSPIESGFKISKELPPVPKDLKQPADVYQIFVNRSQNQDRNETSLSLLTRLFFAIASPDAFYQLRDACTASRQDGELIMPQSTDSVCQAIQTLDRLDVSMSTASILRRYHLVFLVSHRTERETYYKTKTRERTPRKLLYGYTNSTLTKPNKTEDAFRRPNHMALADMMAEAYPDIKSGGRRENAQNPVYQNRLRSFKDRIYSGKNWHQMQQRLSPGILALVPTGGSYHIQNSEVERLSEPLITLFLDVLVELRGDFLQKVSELVSQHIRKILYREDFSQKYVFEDLDETALRQEPLNSVKFIEFCKSHTPVI